MLNLFAEKLATLQLKTTREIKEHKFRYTILFIILLFSFFLRVYRTEDLMGFYYDQGRDGLVIWNLWHEGKLFLTGPVTGLAGIFLGPLYYYLIAPFYLISGGDPRIPAIFLAFTTVLAVLMLYVLGSRMKSRITGFIAVIIGGFSFYLVLAARWFSNPTPMFLLSMLILWNMWAITSEYYVSSIKYKDKSWLWLTLALLIGVSLQFESASAVFYLPMAGIFAWWQRRKLPNAKIITLAALVFAATLLPQILFDFRHDHLIFDSFKRVLVAEKSFRNPINAENLEFKKNYFTNVFNSKIFPVQTKFSIIFYITSLFGLFKLYKKRDKAFMLLSIFTGVPLLFYFFFQGNEGHIYDYYMTGYYFPMILLFSLGLGAMWNKFLGKVIVLIFLFVFLKSNLHLAKDYLKSPVGGHVGITLGTELQAVDWIYGNAKTVSEFNVDIYVPPVIPHSYEYLLLWRGTKFCGENLCGLIKNKNVDTLYTLFEEDPPHPERLVAWLERQKKIGKVEEQITFGNVTVQRRTRI